MYTYLYISLNNKKEAMYDIAYIALLCVSIGNYTQKFC